MNNEKIVLAFAKVKEDMSFLKTEIVKQSKKKETSTLAPVDNTKFKDKLKEQKTSIKEQKDSITRLEKSIIKLENNYKSDIEKTHKIISKVREEFEEKLTNEISFLKADFEEKLADIERDNSFEGEDLY